MPIWLMPLAVCLALLWSATKAKASTCRSVVPSPGSQASPLMASTCLLRNRACAKSSWMPDIVESVEINKPLQANMDADGIGGSVNLVTKTAGEHPTVNISGMGGYTPILGGRGLIETAGTVGQRFGASKRFGVLLGGSYDWNGRRIYDIEPGPDLATLSRGTPARYFEAIDVREYRYYRSRWGLAGSVDFKPSDGSTIYIRGLYYDFHNYGDVWGYSLTDNT